MTDTANPTAIKASLSVSRARLALLKANWSRWPAGSTKGGQFAPKGTSGGGAAPGGSKEPAAPPKGAKPHLRKDDNGKPVTINYPTAASAPDTWSNPQKTATFTPGGATPEVLNGVPFKAWSAPNSTDGWAKVEGQNPALDASVPFEQHPTKRTAAGVLILEPDGRVWLTRPTNSFGGYMNTFPKGTAESGLSLQANAIKEAYEETGLKVKIVGVLGDYERDTSKARMFVAQRVGGTPKNMGWESQAVRLAPFGQAKQLLNKDHDRAILDDLDAELKILSKAAKPKGGHHSQGQARWDAGSPLGGQWKKMGLDGMTLAPTIAGGLEGKNSGYQKKVNAAFSAAQAGDKQAVLDAAAKLKPAYDKWASGNAKTSHDKWNAQAYQYIQQLDADLGSKTKASASADAINGPVKLSALTKIGAKPGGSNPGGLYIDADGAKWIVKGSNNPPATEQAKNEVLASKLILAAGAGAPEMKLVDLEGQYGGGIGVASRVIDNVIPFGNNAEDLAKVRSDFAVHAWLGNYDVIGLSKENTVIGPDGKAINIDPGGAILYRAQGAPKGEAFGNVANEWNSMRHKVAGLPDNPAAWSVYGGMTSSQLATSAKKLEAIDDATIKSMVKAYGPGNDAQKAALAEKLIARKKDVLEKAAKEAGWAVTNTGVTPPRTPKAPAAATAVAAPTATPASGIKKPVFVETVAGASKGWQALTDKAAEVHAKGDAEGLKGIQFTLVGSNSPNALAVKQYVSALQIDLLAQNKASAQAAIAPTAPAPKPGTSIGANPGMPSKAGYQSDLSKPNISPTTKKDMVAHNAKLDAIEKLAGGGDVKGLLSLGYGSNHYGKKQAAYANDVLAAMGAGQFVTVGQKGGTHPALAAAGSLATAAATASGMAAVAQAKAQAPKPAPQQSKPVFRIPNPPDFANWNGPGKGLSSISAFNKQNDDITRQIFALAKDGKVDALKAMTYQPIDNSGNPVGSPIPIGQHKSKNIVAYFNDALKASTTPYAPMAPVRAGAFGKVGELFSKLGKMFPEAATLLQAAKTMGRYAILGKAPGAPLDNWKPEELSLKNGKLNAQDLYEESYARFKQLSQVEQQAIRDYTGAGHQTMNDPKTGIGTHAKTKVAMDAYNKASVLLKPGTILSRRFYFKSDAAKNMKLLEASPGEILKDFGLISTSMKPEVWNGDIQLRVTVGEGVKGLYVAPNPKSGGDAISVNPGESEVVLPYGTKFLVRSVKKVPFKDQHGTWGGKGEQLFVDIVALPNV